MKIILSDGRIAIVSFSHIKPNDGRFLTNPTQPSTRCTITLSWPPEGQITVHSTVTLYAKDRYDFYIGRRLALIKTLSLLFGHDRQARKEIWQGLEDHGFRITQETQISRLKEQVFDLKATVQVLTERLNEPLPPEQDDRQLADINFAPIKLPYRTGNHFYRQGPNGACRVQIGSHFCLQPEENEVHWPTK